MRYTKSLLVAVFLLLFAVTASTNTFPAVRNMAAVITNQHTSLFKECISSFSDKSIDEFETTLVNLNADKVKDGIIRHTGGEYCGSGGCVYELCLSEDKGNYTHVSFGFAAQSLTVKETSTNGFRDLILNNDDDLHMSWNGTAYSLNSQ